MLESCLPMMSFFSVLSTYDARILSTYDARILSTYDARILSTYEFFFSSFKLSS